MEAQRVSPGGFAITVFVGSAIYLVVVNHGWQTLLTIKAVIFMLLGVFFFRSAGRRSFSSAESLDRKEPLQIGRGTGFARKDQATEDADHGADGGAGGRDLLRHEVGLSMVFQLKSA
jgi:hypothetical protein